MSDAAARVALIVNPIAGMGGAVGLKGSDGDRSERARALGAGFHAPQRVLTALQELSPPQGPFAWYAAAGTMGADALRSLGIEPQILHEPASPSTAADTRAAARRAADLRVDLLLFAGGDGTARDILAAVGDALPVLGVPAGVKMHSAVFAVTPRNAGAAAARFLASTPTAKASEPRAVMDRAVTEEGEPAASPQLYGYLRCPRLPALMQAAKASASSGGEGAVLAALRRVAAELREFDVLLLGPGSTLAALKGELGFAGTLLGVDVYANGRCVKRDAREDEIYALIEGRRTALVLGVIGGQGFLLGRGNQQLSPRVLRRVGRDHLRVLASAEKLAALKQSTLYVDTGDEAVDAMLAGYLPVVTGPRRSTMCRVLAGGLDQPALRPAARGNTVRKDERETKRESKRKKEQEDDAVRNE